MSDVNEKLSGLKTILHKAQAYCAYRERCMHEVSQKLREWNVDESRIKNILEKLTAENFISEQRFVSSFVRGKFIHNKWGKIKIAYELRLKKIPDRLINQGLDEVLDHDYLATIKTLAEKKEKELYEKDAFIKKQKIARYIISRGFEADIVFRVLKSSV